MADSSLMRLYSHRELAWEMAVREAQSVYKGSVFGVFWLGFKPLLQTAVPFVLICTTWQKAAGQQLPQLEIAGYMLAGMIPWQILSRGLEESTQLVRDRATLVKQVQFPLETLPLISSLTSLIGAAVSLVVWLIVAFFLNKLSWTCLLLPIPLILLEFLIIGLSWTLMIIGVVLRDIRNVVGLMLFLCGYVSPVVLRQDMVSEKVWFTVMLNPLSHVVVAFRDVMYGEKLHTESWIVFIVTAWVSWQLGSTVLRRNRLWINDLI